jgi:hypothetical protein
MSSSYPKVLHCVVCEDARIEQGGLLTITGFYGILPDFAMLVKNFGAPIARVTFLFISGPGGGGNFSIKLEIKDKNGKSIFKSPLPPFPLSIKPSDNRVSQLIMGVGNIKFPGPGKYQVQFSADGMLTYQDTLEVRPFE